MKLNQIFEIYSQNVSKNTFLLKHSSIEIIAFVRL